MYTTIISNCVCGLNYVHFLQDLKQLAYKHIHTIVTTYEGTEMALQESQNPNVVKNKKEALAFLHDCFATVHADAEKQKYCPRKPQHAEAVPPLSEPSSTALTTRWPKKDACTAEDFENAVVLYFLAPEVAVWRERMEALEEKWEAETIIDFVDSAIEGEIIYGYTYALWNPLFPDLIKIGATFRTPQIRARELSGTGMPRPFVVITELKCRNPFKLERQVHGHYSTVRKYGKKKEFFTITAFEVIEHFNLLKEGAMVDPTPEEQEKIDSRIKSMKRFRDA